MSGKLCGGKLVTLAKVEANRRNSSKSSGPRSQQGKNWSRRNAIKHGILTSALVLGDGKTEDALEFQKLLASIRQDRQPVGKLEEVMVEKIAIALWRLRRLLRFEGQAIERASREESLARKKPHTDEALLQLLAEMQAREKQALAEPSSVPEHWQGIQVAQRREEVLSHWQAGRGGDAAEKLIALLLSSTPALPAPPGAQPESTPDPLAAELSRLRLRAHVPAVSHFSLPVDKDLARILRYEASINRDLTYAINQLERLQRARAGEHVPAPVNVNLSGEQ